MHNAEIVKIRPRERFVALDLAELWSYRELLYFLTWRDIKIRYKQTAIGVAWAVLQPVLTTAVFTVLFATWARFDTGDVPYPVFALSGLLVWLFTNNGITFASNSFVSNTNLVTKVYFPRLIVPLAATLAGLLDLVLGLVILVGTMVYYSTGISRQILFAPLFVVLAFVLTVSLGTMFSALNVRFRDVKFALPFMLQIWMIASPVFYPASMVSEKWRLAFAVNPMTGVLDGFRSALFGTPLHWDIIGISAGVTTLIALAALLIFKRMEDDFADLI